MHRGESIIDKQMFQSQPLVKELQSHNKRGLDQWQAFFLKNAQANQGGSVFPEYSRQYHHTLRHWLLRVYGQMAAIFPEEYQALSQGYISREPLRAQKSNSFEQSFICWVKIHQPELYDLAKVDWLMHASYTAADSQQFDFDRFGQLNEAQQLALRFQLAPSTHFFQGVPYLVETWRAFRQGDLSEARTWYQRSTDAPKVVAYAVCRSEYQPSLGYLDQREWLFFEASTRKTLGDMPEHLLELLPAWIEQGHIVGWF